MEFFPDILRLFIFLLCFFVSIAVVVVAMEVVLQKYTCFDSYFSPAYLKMFGLVQKERACFLCSAKRR